MKRALAVACRVLGAVALGLLAALLVLAPHAGTAPPTSPDYHDHR